MDITNPASPLYQLIFLNNNKPIIELRRSPIGDWILVIGLGLFITIIIIACIKGWIEERNKAKKEDKKQRDLLE